jgi:hypothetical protein
MVGLGIGRPAEFDSTDMIYPKGVAPMNQSEICYARHPSLGMLWGLEGLYLNLWSSLVIFHHWGVIWYNIIIETAYIH